MGTLLYETPLTRFLVTQTVTQLRQMRGDVRHAIDDAKRHIDELEAELARIDTALNEKARGGKRAAVVERKPETPSVSLRQAILNILNEKPSESWTTQDILDELTRRGQSPGGSKPLNTVGSRLLELHGSGKIARVERGTYALTPAPFGGHGARESALHLDQRGGGSDP